MSRLRSALAPLALLGGVLGIAWAGAAPNDSLGRPLRWRAMTTDGAPLPDAHAVLHLPAAAPLSFTSDGDGRFVTPPLPVPLRDARLVLSAPDHATVIFEPLGVRSDRDDGAIGLGDLVLDPGYTVEVTITDPDGAPLANAELFRVPPGASFPPRDSSRPHRVRCRLNDDARLARTDERGRVTVGLSADAPAFVVRRLPEYGPTAVSVASEPPTGETTVRLTATPTLQLSLEAGGASPRLASPPVTVVIGDGGVEWSLDVSPDRGTATIPLVAGRAGSPLKLRVDAKGFESADRSLNGVDRTEATLALEPLALALEPLALAWTRFEAYDATSRESLPVQALVLGRARDDAPDRIDFVPDWSCLSFVEDGRALAAAPAGTYDALIRSDGYLETLARRVLVEGSDDEPGEVLIAMERAPAVSGQVIDAATGAPIPGATVLVRKTSRDLQDLPLRWKLAGTIGLLDAVTTDQGGAFSLQPSAWEEITVEANATGFASTTLGPIPRRETDALIIALEAGHRVAGSIRGTSERPPFATSVYLFDPRHTIRRRAEVVDGGSFEFPHVAPGGYRLYADRDDRALLSGRYGSLGHALIQEMHGQDRGLTIVVEDGDIVDLEVPSPGRGGLTPRPVRTTASFETESDSAERLTLFRLDDRVPAWRVVSSAVRADARSFDLPTLAEGAYQLVLESGDGDPIALVPLDAYPPGTVARVDPRPGALQLILFANVVIPQAIELRHQTFKEETFAATDYAERSTRTLTAEPGVRLFEANELLSGSWLLTATDADGAVLWIRRQFINPAETAEILIEY